MKKILIIEDNEVIVKGVKYLLEQEGFKVNVCLNASDAIKVIGKEAFSLIILDISLPDGDGFELCKYIKKYTDIPVIFLTAKDEEQDVVKGIDMGAEDYVIKPFRARELISRINNVLRRFENNNIIKCGNVEINTDTQTVCTEGRKIEFTNLEYKILLLLFTNINKTVLREQILEKTWDITENFVNDNTLTVNIKRIRAKLGKNDIIKTVKGLGYKVENNEEK